MKTEYREHPLGTPGLSARRMARLAGPSQPLLRFFASLFPGPRGAAASWEKGAEGEEAVARKLGKLPRDYWITLHDVPLGTRGRNVDHLVIGTGGVFSVNAKNLSGKVLVKTNAFLVGGFPEPHLRVARDEGERVSQRLSAVVGTPVPVDPVIVVMSPELRIDSQPDGVRVLALGDVTRWFQERGPILDRPAASRIYEAARAKRTWSADVLSLRAASPAPSSHGDRG
ncbi:MAG: NERD domain-containing protein [Actinomycetota bacterium]|nr:NERD domain-containing protein [Actinomycetota bacterium]